MVIITDNQGKTFDRFTAYYLSQIITRSDGVKYLPYRGMSEHPSHPQGFGQYGELELKNDFDFNDLLCNKECGLVVELESLPVDVKKCIENDLTEFEAVLKAELKTELEAEQIKSLPVHANDDDRKCALSLITAILDKGDKISVHHCEGLELKESTDKLAILKAMGATGIDTIECLDGKTNESKGWFSLIYHNGSEGEPMILISDYVANDYCESVYQVVDGKLGD